MTKFALQTGNRLDLETTVGVASGRFFVTTGANTKRMRNRFGGELSDSERAIRHEHVGFAARRRNQIERDRLREQLEDEGVSIGFSGSENAGCCAAASLCPVTGEPRVNNGSMRCTSDDGATDISIVYSEGVIVSAYVRPTRRWQY